MSVVSINPIPQIVGGTVADADKKEVNPPASGPFRPQQVSIKVTDPGSHVSFIATLEGFVGGTWANFAPSNLNPNIGLAADELGVAIPVAEAQAGVVLNFDVNFPKIRVGLAGDNVAGDGAGIIVPKQTKG